MIFKKKVNGSRADTPHYIHKTATDTITTLPADIYANDTTATVGLKGNMSQSGTPTSDNPVMPQGTGERTGNLINVPALSDIRWATQYPALLAAINSLPNGVYTMSISYKLTSRNDTTDSSVCGWYIAKDSRVLSNVRRSWETAQIGEIITAVDTFTIDDNNRGAFTALYLYGCGINGVGTTGSANAENIMLNLGSTPLPYEPYGIKIPISSAGQTTPVYLGEVETTRRIKKLVLTGEEKWALSNNRLMYTVKTTGAVSYETVLCSHYIGAKSFIEVYNTANSTAVTNQGVYVNSGLTDIVAWKTYLAQQYAAGTPVTVWYVLAEPTTGIVNEPLHKIGDYADTVSGITIPTITGKDTFDVNTTLKPSEVTVNYKGWHPAIVHERTNGAWT